MNKLNKQYFETRKKHKESYKKGTSGVAVIVLIITVSYFIYNNWEYLNPKSSTFKTEELLSDLNKFTIEPILYKDSLFNIELPEGFYYRPLNDKLRLFAISGDSINVISLFVKIEQSRTNSQSLIEHWQEQLNKSDSEAYQFQVINIDTLNNIRTELATMNVHKGNSQLFGLIQLTKIGSTLYIIQGTTLETNWAVNKQLIAEFIESFESRTGI